MARPSPAKWCLALSSVVDPVSIQKWVWFAGEGFEGVGYFVEVGADVGGGDTNIVIVGVASECPRNGVAEVAFNPGQRGMAEPVSAGLLRGDPRKMSADADPEVVVSAGSDWASIFVAQQLAAHRSVTLLVVVLKVRHQGGGDRLPAE